MAECAQIRVSGRVHGVGFRWFTRDEARALGLGGWVRNRRDGTVEAEVHGERARVERLVERLAEGPAAAQVADVAVEWVPGPARPAPGDFEIRPTA